MERLAEHDDGDHAEHLQRLVEQDVRPATDRPDRHEKSTEKASRRGSDSSAARWLNSDSAHDHAGKEGA